MNIHEQSYCVTRKELLAVITALRTFHHHRFVRFLIPASRMTYMAFVIGRRHWSVSGQPYVLNRWDPSTIRQLQLEDPDLCIIFTSLENRQDKPKWDQVSNGTSALKTIWRQWDRLQINTGMLYSTFVTFSAVFHYGLFHCWPVKDLLNPADHFIWT
jgi:hypothetical protein